MLLYAEGAHSLTHHDVLDMCENVKAEESWADLRYMKGHS